MNTCQPIYTEKAQCQDCYRCVRNCPVKAIKIEQGVASVVDELCIQCGKCVSSCPAEAKRVRNDRTLVKVLIESGAKIIASIAPSYLGEFEGIPPAAIIAALKKIGFSGVSETALGAQEVSAHAARLLAENKPHIWISSACPTVVEYIRKYRSELVGSITPMLSPLLAHCRLLKKEYGESTRVVFFGPCIAKKKEAHAHPELLDAALTFEDLRTMIDEAGIDLATIGKDTMGFIPRAAQEGALYPVDGGMIACIKAGCQVTDQQAMHFSGIDEICSVLDSVQKRTLDKPIFLELLACAGGCVNGPCASAGQGTLTKRMAVLEKSSVEPSLLPRQPSIEIAEKFSSSQTTTDQFSEEAISEVLRRTGKHTSKDELNCGGCGYGNCRDFARAVLGGKAETAMCVSYMRQLASKKANKLMLSIPSGVVIVDKNLRIIECNAQFASLAGSDAQAIYNQFPGMAGAVLEKTFPVAHLFRHVLETGEDILDKDLRIGDRVLHCTIFSIEPDSSAGGIFSDVTAPELKKDEIINRAQTVIRNNLMTVQKIAYLLGENASETEMVLSTIIDSFKHGQAEAGENGR